MKNLRMIAVVAMMLSSVLAVAKSNECRTEVWHSKDFSDFQKIEASQSIIVTYVQGNEYKLEANIPEECTDFSWEVEGQTLKMKNGNSTGRKVIKFFGIQINTSNGYSGRPVEVTVIAPNIENVRLQGACEFVTEKLECHSEELIINMSGASKVRAFGIDAKSILISGSGACEGQLGFKDTGKLHVSQSGACVIEMNGNAKDVSVSISGACDLKMAGNYDAVSGSLSGACNINIKGTVANNKTRCYGASSFSASR